MLVEPPLAVLLVVEVEVVGVVGVVDVVVVEDDDVVLVVEVVVETASAQALDCAAAVAAPRSDKGQA